MRWWKKKKSEATTTINSSSDSDKSSSNTLKIDIIVNNAGYDVVRTLGEITPADFAAVYDVNVRGVIFLTQALLPHLNANGRIINMSSVGARGGFKAMSLYCSSKAALEGLTRCWAAELGANGTTVNCVNPGPVPSDMLDGVPGEIIASMFCTSLLRLLTCLVNLSYFWRVLTCLGLLSLCFMCFQGHFHFPFLPARSISLPLSMVGI